MSLYLSIPLLFLKFWFFDAPVRLIKYFLTFNHAALQFLSLPLMVRTFFTPLKNEYRKGLVGFSIVTGIILKTILIILDLFVMYILITFEILFILFFMSWPFLSISILFLL